ncbi:MAG: O-antigen ligase family protein [Agathobacter sp.]|nr:O-antigen ligase family protein [Agathobacter sp.]
MKQKQQKTKIKKQPFNDLLLPIIITLCVLPFTVYLAEYDYGFSQYNWHSDYSIIQDFYTYYRQIFLLVIAAFMLIILAFRLPLYKEQTKNFKIFYPLFGYSILVLISSLFSINYKASWIGNGISIETAFVLIGYVLIGFYTYQIMTKTDYQSILRGIYIMFIPMSIVGWFQVFKHDLLNYEWMQKIVMSEELFDMYGGDISDVFSGNNVFLTLYNPNFAAIFLVMFICVFFVLTIYASDKKSRIINGLFLADALILCWFTYTRAALVGLAIAFIAFVLCIRKNDKMRLLKYILPSIAAILIVFFVYDFATGGKYINRLIDEKKETQLDSILTTERGVEITYKDELYILTLAEDKSSVILMDESETIIPTECTKDDELILPFATDAFATYMDLDGLPCILTLLEDTTLVFTYDDDSYYYFTDWGKFDSMTDIAHVDFHGLESMGSGRIYIWSRILPLLPNYIFIGSGPDTFAEVFPQNDYVGKMIYADDPARIIERAHNDYLMRWIQTGLLSLMCLLVFYGCFIKKCFHYYKQNTIQTTSDKLGFGCFLGCIGYLACSLFSDSTLYTTPTFYVFIGLALAATHSNENCL